MRPTTTTALALAGTALALPAGVALAASDDQSSPDAPEKALAAPFAGHTTINARMKAERRDALAARYIPRVVRLERRIAKLEGDRFHTRAHREHLRGASIGELRVELRRSRRELRRAKAVAAVSAPSATGSVAPANLQAIAACESGGNPSTDTGNGFYGKYQFTQNAWASVGG